MSSTPKSCAQQHFYESVLNPFHASLTGFQYNNFASHLDCYFHYSLSLLIFLTITSLLCMMWILACADCCVSEWCAVYWLSEWTPLLFMNGHRLAFISLHWTLIYSYCNLHFRLLTCGTESPLVYVIWFWSNAEIEAFPHKPFSKEGVKLIVVLSKACFPCQSVGIYHSIFHTSDYLAIVLSNWFLMYFQVFIGFYIKQVIKIYLLLFLSLHSLLIL